MWTITLPLRINVSKNKQFSLNLNQYRNAHYQTLDRAKKNFDKVAKGLIRGLPKLEAITLEYVLYPANRQICDVNNVCSIVDKFFSDSLVTHGVIEDDNYNIIADSRFRFGRIDRENPRVDCIIREALEVPPEVLKEESEEEIMYFILTQADVAKALRTYLAKQVVIPETTSLRLVHQPDGDVQVHLEEANAAQAPVTVAKTPGPVTVRKPAAKAEPTPKPTPAVQAAPAAQPVQEQLPAIPADTSFPFGANAPVEAATEPEEAPVVEEAPAAPVPPTPTPGKSLFAGLRKPVNPAP